MRYNPSDFPEAENYYAQAISLPIYFGLSDDDVKLIVDKMETPLNYQTIF
jgi:dTDP-4-amino-4,6-dideoxygalactose transaminase